MNVRNFNNTYVNNRCLNPPPTSRTVITLFGGGQNYRIPHDDVRLVHNLASVGMWIVVRNGMAFRLALYGWPFNYNYNGGYGTFSGPVPLLWGYRLNLVGQDGVETEQTNAAPVNDGVVKVKADENLPEATLSNMSVDWLKAAKASLDKAKSDPEFQDVKKLIEQRMKDIDNAIGRK
ncbi:hypothetical protein PQX77_011390 [Marasmius sp. AFHP31]|nr:hypothetical protein PQX77_011390 [Marasmius sp. AFHP31]